MLGPRKTAVFFVAFSIGGACGGQPGETSKGHLHAQQSSSGEAPEGTEREATRQLAQRIGRLVRLLDADRFATRQAAHTRLVAMGESALMHLLPVPEVGSLERRRRQQAVIDTIQRIILDRAFRELAAANDDDLDMDQAMWLLARIINPTARRKPLMDQLDALAARVRRKLGQQIRPRDAPPREVVEAMRQVLFVDYGLTGAVANYDHPDNSSLERVLARRRGLPILLSHIMISVADRLEVPLVGLSIPGRYMVKYDGRRAPAGSPQDDIIVDPFGDGVVLTAEQLAQRIPGFDPQRHAVASPKRDTIVRMLRNLASDYTAVQNASQAAEVERYLAIVASGP